MQFVYLAVSILVILLAFFAQRLGIDKNAVWGTGRILILIFGVALLVFAILIHFWKTHRISAEVQQKVTAAGQKIQNRISRLIHWLTACQSLSLVISILVVILISVYVIWYTSLGRFTTFSPVADTTYVDLGEAFLHGQLSLLLKPDPRLVALPNPYDSKQRNSIFNTDLSYFKSKFYFYWGPAPAIIFAITEWIFRSRPPDQLVVLISFLGLAVVLLVLLYHIRKQYFPNAPGISIPFFIMAALVNIPYLFILGRPQIYETSIIAGQFFLILGVLAWFLYQTKAKYFWLVLAGLSWGLAVSSRYSLAVSIAVFSVFVLYNSYQNEHVNGRFRSGKNYLSNLLTRINWKAIISLLIPLAVCGFAMAIYNYARFGNPLETGFKYQLTLFDPLNHYYSVAYIPSNFFVYLAYPVKSIGSFPFFKSVLIQYNLLPGWASVPRGKLFDQIFFGIFQSLPVIWSVALLVPLTVIGLVKRRHRKIIDDHERWVPGLWPPEIPGKILPAQSLLMTIYHDH